MIDAAEQQSRSGWHRWWKRAGAAWCGLVLAAGAASALSEGPRSEGPRVEREPARLESAEAELARAVDLKGRAQKLRGKERVAALEAALSAYRAVVGHWPDDREHSAEASFRAGELLRRLERDADACAEFTRARTLGVGTSFAPRAGLELAHAARRAGDLEAARNEFDAVAKDEQAERRYRDDAALWVARLDAELGHVEVARRAFEELARSSESVLDRIDAYDEWCASFVDAGDLEAAAGVLARCREALRDVSEEETSLGERVRSALARMSSVRRLERAVRARANGVALTKGDTK